MKVGDKPKQNHTRCLNVAGDEEYFKVSSLSMKRLRHPRSYKIKRVWINQKGVLCCEYDGEWNNDA